MPSGNRAWLLGVLLVLWACGVAYITLWYVSFSSFDGYEAKVLPAIVTYGIGGLVPVAVGYFAIGALLGRSDRSDPGTRSGVHSRPNPPDVGAANGSQ
jgi:hypothetical protein